MKKVLMTLAAASLCFLAVSCGNCCNKQQEEASEAEATEQVEETKACCDSAACAGCPECAAAEQTAE